MASAAIFSSMRRRSSPSLEAFLAPVNVSDAEILEALKAVAAELVSSFSGDSKTTPFFQVKNSRSLIRKIQVISILLDASLDLGLSEKAPSPAPAVFLCFKELYLHLYRCKILIDFVKGSSKLWLLLQNHSISGHFHDLNQEISTLLDVFPLGELNLPEEVKEQVELLGKQSRNSKLFVDSHDDLLRFKLYHFLSQFENGKIPEKNALRDFFIEKLRILDVKSCRFEIEFLEEQIANHDGDIEPTASILNGFVALLRYCRFLLFGFDDELDFERYAQKKNAKKGMLTQEELAEMFLTIPKDFCCPISWDLMRDPVLISTGHTYERSSISRWMQERHSTCPKTGQILLHTKLIPNRALHNLIAHWCSANGIPYEPPENSDYFPENNNYYSAGLPSKAQVEATKATANLLVYHLVNGLPRAQSLAAMEIRLLAKTGKQNRACIAEAGAIPLLEKLLSSEDTSAQENSITALLNLSILDTNKSVIMGLNGCLGSIIGVLINGLTVEARENAAAVLFSLSSVHEFKKVIAREEKAVRALARLLVAGTPRGRRDAATAIFNLSTDGESCGLLVGFGVVRALVRALVVEEAAEEAAGALALIVRRLPEAVVAEEEEVVEGLVGMMKWGTPKGKENAVAALLEMCKNGGPEVVERVGRGVEMVGLLQSLMMMGTKRARRKAATLAKVFERWGDRVWLGAAGYGGESEERYSSSVAMVSVPVL